MICTRTCAAFPICGQPCDGRENPSCVRHLRSPLYPEQVSIFPEAGGGVGAIVAIDVSQMESPLSLVPTDDLLTEENVADFQRECEMLANYGVE